MLKSDDDDDDDDEFEEQQASKSEFPKKPTKTDINKFNKLIIKKETGVNRELFTEHFKFQMPTVMLKALYNTNDRKENNLIVNTIKSGLSDLKDEIKKISEEEREIEKPHKIVEIVEDILKFNKQKQEGSGLKILSPTQMLSRLPIFLVQLKAGDNSEKLKNEIRQLLHSLYRSKNMSKQVYNDLIKYI